MGRFSLFLGAVLVAGSVSAQVTGDPDAVAPVVYSAGPPAADCADNDPTCNEAPSPAYAPSDDVADDDAPDYGDVTFYPGVSLLPDDYYYWTPGFAVGFGWPYVSFGWGWPYWGYGPYWGGPYWGGFFGVVAYHGPYRYYGHGRYWDHWRYAGRYHDWHGHDWHGHDWRGGQTHERAFAHAGPHGTAAGYATAGAHFSSASYAHAQRSGIALPNGSRQAYRAGGNDLSTRAVNARAAHNAYWVTSMPSSRGYAAHTGSAGYASRGYASHPGYGGSWHGGAAAASYGSSYSYRAPAYRAPTYSRGGYVAHSAPAVHSSSGGGWHGGGRGAPHSH
ncbi:MAG TPA: hypothetical protein VFB32_16970 [Rudaea sp.]|nr:hypothetical protein [Rudaea sp.]